MDAQLRSHCPAFVWKFEVVGWFNPTDVGNSSKEGRGYTETNLKSSTALRLPDPEKAFQLYVHEKEGITFTSHQVKQFLNGRGHLWMSDQKTLRYQVVLMENPGITMPTLESSLPFHVCLETVDHWTKPWEGLSEDPLAGPEEIWYTGGSSFVLDGKRRTR